uniref:Uncharacterized protein n=1 Tax=Iridovirus LCIVAC01 TaxID=2506607 RepID=A0A481YQA3_9VIRU|nr:MAG: hypothetical protein LCIVAC01_01900 [Iridovirus LCIVAC01]
MRTFTSRKEAAEFVKFKSKIKTSISTIMKAISKACTGKQNSAYGYRWRNIKTYDRETSSQ